VKTPVKQLGALANQAMFGGESRTTPETMSEEELGASIIVKEERLPMTFWGGFTAGAFGGAAFGLKFRHLLGLP